MSVIWILINTGLVYFMTAGLMKRDEAEGKTGLFLTISLVAEVIQLSLTVILLSLLKRYSLTALTLINGIQLLLLAFAVSKHAKTFFGWREFLGRVKKERWNKLLLVMLIVGFFLYGLFPSKYMLGGRDYGLYILNGIHLSQTGSLQYESDVFINENYEKLEGVVSPGYPALTSPVNSESFDGEPGDISPQFMPMFSALLAVGYDLAGLEGLIRVNMVIGVLALLVLYYLAKEFFHKKAALLLTAFMLLNPAQLWGARITETEILSQVLFFSSMYVFLQAWKSGEKKRYMLAGFLLGIGCMNRIDTLIYGLGLFVMLVYCILWNRNLKKPVWAACKSYMLVSLAALLYGSVFSTVYFADLWNGGALSTAVYINAAGLLAALFAEAATRFFYKSKGKNRILQVVENKTALAGCCCVLGAVFLFLYLVRPHMGEGMEYRSLVEFCWYTTVFMVGFMVWGIYKLLKSEGRNSERYFVLLLIGMSSLLAYLIRPSITPDHIWASRRWITVNIPFVLLFGCYGLIKCTFWNPRIAKGLQVLAGAAVSVLFLWRCKPFLLVPIMDGIEDAYERLAWQMAPDTVYFTTDEKIASFLRYVYDKSVYMVDTEDLSRLVNYVKDEGSVFYVGNSGALGEARFHLGYETIYEDEVRVKTLESSVGRYPRTIYEERFDLSVSRLTPQESSVIRLGRSDMRLDAAHYEEGRIVAEKQGGTIFYGPYAALEKGRYRVTLDLEYHQRPEGEFYVDIVSSGASAEHAKQEIAGNGITTVDFELEEKRDGIEIRLFAGPNDGVVCKEILLERLE